MKCVSPVVLLIIWARQGEEPLEGSVSKLIHRLHHQVVKQTNDQRPDDTGFRENLWVS